MSNAVYAQLVALTTGLLLLTAVMQVWRRSLVASVRLLAVQGAALGAMVATIGLHEGEAVALAVALMVLAVKSLGIPWALLRTAATTGATREESPLINQSAGLLIVAGLTTLAYLITQPLVGGNPDPAVRAVPVALAVILIGFLVLLTRRHALSQLIGFVVIDNGIAAVAFLSAGGVPLVVELGVSLDVLLVVLILRVLTARMHSSFGAADLDDLKELRD